MSRLIITLLSLFLAATLAGCVIVNRETVVHHHYDPSQEAPAEETVDA